MVTVDLVGRLGNQMFQIATCMSYAWRTNQEFIIPPRSENPHLWPTYFDFGEFTGRFRAPNYYEEKSHAYEEIPNIQNVRLRGYFQSEKYFRQDREDVKRMFFSDRRFLSTSNNCAIHIRLGDYVSMQDKHPVVSTEYLYASIEYMLRANIRFFVVFSDDINPAMKILRSLGFNDGPVHFEPCEYTAPLLSLVTMASCANQICANSSFSWWASWLNENPDKKVIMPRRWFGPGNSHLETKDIYPANTIIL